MGEVDRGKKTKCAWDDRKKCSPHAFSYPLPSIQTAYTTKSERGLCGGESILATFSLLGETGSKSRKWSINKFRGGVG